MKYKYLFSFVFIVSACTTVADIKPEMPAQPAPSPTSDVRFAVPITTAQEPQKDDTPMPQPTQPSPSSALESLIEKAKVDLTQRLSIPLVQIDLVEAKEVVWPNASLGCPQPGMVYADVLTPGYLILLEANSREYEYHASKGKEVICCENPTPPVPGIPGEI